DTFARAKDVSVTCSKSQATDRPEIERSGAASFRRLSSNWRDVPEGIRGPGPHPHVEASTKIVEQLFAGHLEDVVSVLPARVSEIPLAMRRLREGATMRRFGRHCR